VAYTIILYNKTYKDGLSLYLMVEQIEEVSQEEQKVIDKYQRRRRKTLSLVIPTFITGIAISIYGGIQISKESNTTLESTVYQYQELTKESQDIGMSLDKLESIDEKNKDLKNSLASLVTEYKTRGKTLENEITRVEETDEVKSYNRNVLLNYGAAYGGMFLVVATALMHNLHIGRESIRRSMKLHDVRYKMNMKQEIGEVLGEFGEMTSSEQSDY